MPEIAFGVMAALRAPLWLHGRGPRHLPAPAARTGMNTCREALLRRRTPALR